MKKSIIVIFITLALFITTGCSTNTTSSAEDAWNAKAQEHDHNSHEHRNNAEKHSHSMLNIPKNQSIPTMSFIAHRDAKEGYNIEIITTNFTFTPENVNRENAWGTGHAHIYIDGNKISRVYGNWFHLTKIEKGTRTIEIGLNANDHSAYAVNGTPITFKQKLVVE